MRRLRKLNKQLERREHFFENVINVIAEDLPQEVDHRDCSECGKGKIMETDLGKYVSEKCDHCSFKKLVKK